MATGKKSTVKSGMINRILMLERKNDQRKKEAGKMTGGYMADRGNDRISYLEKKNNNREEKKANEIWKIYNPVKTAAEQTVTTAQAPEQTPAQNYFDRLYNQAQTTGKELLQNSYNSLIKGKPAQAPTVQTTVQTQGTKPATAEDVSKSSYDQITKNLGLEGYNPQALKGTPMAKNTGAATGTKKATGSGNVDAIDRVLYGSNRAERFTSKVPKVEMQTPDFGKGNIDLNARTPVQNADGTISTEQSFSVNIDGKEVLLPKVVNGKVVSEEEAINHYYETGENLGIFDTPEEADEYAEELHNRQEKYYGNRTDPMQRTNTNGFQQYIQQANQQGTDYLSSPFGGNDKFFRNKALTAINGAYTRQAQQQIAAQQAQQKQQTDELNQALEDADPQYFDTPELRDYAYQYYSEQKKKKEEEKEKYYYSGDAVARKRGEEEYLRTPQGELRWLYDNGKTEANIERINNIINQNPDLFDNTEASFSNFLSLRSDKDWQEWFDKYAPRMGTTRNNGAIKGIDEEIAKYDKKLEQLEEAKEKWEPINQYEADAANSDYSNAFRPEILHRDENWGRAGNKDEAILGLKDPLERTYVIANNQYYYREETPVGNWYPECYMTDKQIETFTKYMNAGMRDEAQAYYDAIKPYLNEQLTAYHAQKWGEMAHIGSGSEFTTGAASVVMNALGGASGLYGTITSFLGNEEAKDPNSWYYYPTNMAGAIRGERADALGQRLESLFGNGWYDVGTFLSGVEFSMLDNGFAMLLGGGIGGAQAVSQGTVQLIMSSEATASAMVENLKRGLDPTEAAIMAIGSGGIEALTEKYSLEALLNPNVSNMLGDWKQMAKYVGKNILAEGSEEAASDVLNLVMDKACAVLWDHKTEIEEQADAYMRQMMAENPGYSKEDAQKWYKEGMTQAWSGFWQQVGMDALAGAASGGFMAGGRIGMNSVQNMMTGSNIRQGSRTSNNENENNGIWRKTTENENIEFLANSAAQLREGTNSREMGEKVLDKLKKGKHISNYELGKLSTNLEFESSEEIRKATKDAAESEIRKQLVNNGVQNEEADQLKGLVYKAGTQGIESLSRNERKALMGNEMASQIYMEMAEPGKQDVSAVVRDAAKAAKTAGYQATAEARSMLDTVRSIAEGKGGYTLNTAKIGKDSLKDARKEVAVANDSTVNALGGREAIGNAASSVIAYTSDAKNADDAKAGNIVGFENGKVQVQFADGTTQAMNPAFVEMAGANENAQGIVGYMKTMPGVMSDRVATKAMAALDAAGENASGRFAQDVIAINLAARMGQQMPGGISMDSETANEIWKNARADFEEAEQKRVANKNKTTVTPGKGKASFGGVQYGTKEWTKKVSGLDESTRRSANAVAEVAKALGHSVEFIYDDSENGVKTNGSYNEDTGVVTVNLAAQRLVWDPETKGWKREENGKLASEGAINPLATVPHEFTHWIQQNSENGYAQLREFVMNDLAGSGVDVEQLISDTIRNYNQFYKDNNISRQMTIDDAIYEIVANSCESLFTSEAFANKLKQQNAGLYGKVKSYVQKLIAKLRTALKGVDSSLHYEAKLIKDAEEMARIWGIAHDDAIDSIAKNIATEPDKVGGKTYSAEQINETTALLNEAKAEPVNTFSITAPVQVRKDGMVAVHNLDERSLLSDLAMKGFPMPSIAVLSDKVAWEDYGPISIFFGENAVDFSDGTVYAGDAYTPAMGNYQATSAEDALAYLRKQKLRNPKAAYSTMDLFNNFIRVQNMDLAREKVNAYRNMDKTERVAEKRRIKAIENSIMDQVAEFLDREENTNRYTRTEDRFNFDVAYGIMLAAEEMNGRENLSQQEKYEILQESLEKAAQENDSPVYDYGKDGNALYDDMLEFIDGATKLASTFIESKPNRILDFGAVNAVVLPNDVQESTIQALKNAGVNNIITYDPNVKNARAEALKSVPKNVAGTSFSITQQQNAEYMDAVESGDKKTQREMLNAAANQEGYTIRAYHGTNAKFNSFKGGNRGEMWFASTPETAYKRENMYDTYLKMKNPYEVTYYIGADSKFDPTNVTEEGRHNGHDGAIVHFKLNPDYVEMNLPILSDFAKTLPATDDFGDNFTFMPHGKDRENLAKPGELMIDFMKRGAKETLYDWYVVYKPEQIKSAELVTYDDNGNVIPLSERFNKKEQDIRYSITKTKYDYKALTQKPDIEVTTLNALTEKQIKEEQNKSTSDFARDVISGIKERNGGKAEVYNKDTNKDIKINKDSVKHSIGRKLSEGYIQVSYQLDSILKNAIGVNELKARDNTNYSTVLLGIGETNDSYYAVRFIVNNKTSNAESYDILYSVSKNEIKKEGSVIKTPGEGIVKSISGTPSKMSIQNLLSIVKNSPDIAAVVSKDVADNIGIERPIKKGISENLSYSIQRQNSQEKKLYSEMDQAHENVRKLREEYKAMKPEYDAWVEKITSADNPEAMMEEYKEWEKGYKKKYEQMYDAEQAYKEANKRYEDYIEQRDVAEEQEKIKQSGMTEADWRRNEAKKEFGYTTNFNEAGYLLPDGKMLNFSGEKGQHNGHRYEDHRRIGTIYASHEMQGGAAMNAFMKDGNIRVMAETPGLDISTVSEPTSEQYSQIRNMVRQKAREEYFSVDLTDEKGYNAGNLEYEGRLNPDRVVNDIKTYFRTGEVPAQNVLEKFFSITRQHPDMDVKVWMDSVPESSLATEAERELLRQYKSLRIAIDLDREKQRNYKKRIAELEAKGDSITKEEKRMLDGLKIRLENSESTQAQHEAKMERITSDKGFAGMMYAQQQLMNDYVQGKTQDEVIAAVSGMEKAAEALKDEIGKTAEELKALAEEEGVRRVRSRIGTATLDKVAARIRKNYNSTINKQELQSDMARIRLMMESGAEYETVAAEIEDLAGRILEGRRSSEKNQSLEYLKGITLRLSRSQIKELTGSDSGIKELRKMMAGSGIKVVDQERANRRNATVDAAGNVIKGNAASLDANWDELVSFVPALDHYNGYDTDNALDQAKAVAEFVMNAMEEQKESGKNEFAGMMDQVFMDLSGELANIDMNLPADPSARKQVQGLVNYIMDLSKRTKMAGSKVSELEAKLEAMVAGGKKAASWSRAMKADVQQTIDYFNKTAKMAVDQAKRNRQDAIIQQLKSENVQKMMKANDEWRALIQRDADARRQAEKNALSRRKMSTVMNRINKLLSSETDQQNIPENYKGLARELLGLFVDNDRGEGGRKLTNANKTTLDNTKRLLDIWEQQDGPYDPGVFTYEGTDDERAIGMIVADDLSVIRDAMAEWNNKYKGKNKLDTLKQMGKTLERMQEATSEIYQIIQSARTMDLNGRKYQVEEMALKFLDGVKNSRFKGEATKEFGKKLEMIKKLAITGNLTPEYFFKNLKNDGLDEIWNEFKRGENKFGLEVKKAENRLNEIAKKYGYEKWDMSKTHQVQTLNGTVELTTEQLMALWATWKREHTPNQEQETFHLERGGFYAPENKKGKGLSGKVKENARPHPMNKETMTKVSEMLTDEQKAYVDEMVEYMSKDMSELGNEASMRMYGIKKYKEKYYYPIKQWSGVANFRSDNRSQATDDNRAAHKGWSKRKTANASNAIQIGDFTATVVNHVYEMMNYNTMAPAIEAMNKMLNWQQQEYPGDGTIIKRNMEAVFKQEYGSEKMGYLNTLLEDMNGGVVQDPRGKVLDKLLSVFKKGAVAGSLSVAAQQPLSYIRAAMEISPKYLAMGIKPGTVKKNYQEMMAHSGVAVIKDIGRFDMGYGASIKEYLTPEAYKTRGEKIREKITDISTGLPEVMDRWTWTKMWQAVKLEQKALHPDMDVKSDEFLNMVGERFNEVMRRTQVYDSLLVKSSNMRSKSFGMKSLTSFMAEPTLTLNVLMDAIQNVKEKGGMKKVAMASATFLLGAIAQAAAKGLFGAGRNPDEDKTRAENFAYRMMNNLISEANPLGLIPGYSDLVEVLTKGKLTNDAMTPFGKLYDIAQTVLKAEKTNPYRVVEDTVGQIMQLFTGVPLKNIMRDARAMVNFFAPDSGLTQIMGGKAYANRENSAAVMKYQAIDTIMKEDLIGLVNGWMGDAGYKTTKTAYKERIKEAEAAGDTETAEALRDYTGSTASASEQNTNAYIQEQMKTGRMSSDDARKKIKETYPDRSDDSVWWTVDRMEYENQTGKEVKGSYYRLTDAINNNSSKEITDAVKTMVEHGVDTENIKKWIGDKDTGFKTRYLELPNGPEKIALKNALIMAYKAAGLKEEEAKKRINKWK